MTSADVDYANAQVIHSYEAAGEYEISIEGTFEALGYKGSYASNNYLGMIGKLKSVENLGDLNYKDLDSAFYYAQNLESFAGGVTKEVISMREMFSRASKLSDIDVSSFDTSKVSDMHAMFYHVAEDSLDLSNFNTSNVTTMRHMFDGATKLKSLNLSSFDTRKVTNMMDMFFKCHELENLDISSFDTSRVEHMHGMFEQTYKLESLVVDSLVSSKAKNVSFMFLNSGVKEIYARGWDISNLTSSSGVFNVQNANSLVVYCDQESGSLLGENCAVDLGDSIVSQDLVVSLDPGNSLSYPGSGSTLFDMSGANSDFTINSGGGVAVSSFAGGSLDARNNRIGKYILVNSGATTPSKNMSAEIWVHPTQLGGNKTIWANAYNRNIRIRFSGSSLQFYHFPANINYLQSGFVTGQWYHIAVSVNGDEIKLFVNGNRVGSWSVAHSPDTSTQVVLVGNYNSTDTFGEEFLGYIGTLRHYNRGLNESEIQHNYSLEKSRYGH